MGGDCVVVGLSYIARSGIMTLTGGEDSGTNKPGFTI